MIAGVVLAGGKSRRMGTDKSQLKFSGTTLLEHSKKILAQSGIENIYVSGKQGIVDIFPNKGPLAGISACLDFLSEYNHVLFITVDMPLINKEIILKLIDNKNQKVSYFEHQFFPMLICNNFSNRKTIKQQLKSDVLSIKNLLEKIAVTPMKSTFPIEKFFNANTAEEWLKVNELCTTCTTQRLQE